MALKHCSLPSLKGSWAARMKDLIGFGSLGLRPRSRLAKDKVALNTCVGHSVYRMQKGRRHSGFQVQMPVDFRSSEATTTEEPLVLEPEKPAEFQAQLRMMLRRRRNPPGSDSILLRSIAPGQKNTDFLHPLNLHPRTTDALCDVYNSAYMLALQQMRIVPDLDKKWESLSLPSCLWECLFVQAYHLRFARLSPSQSP